MKERVVSICLAAALLLGGCGSSGGSSAAQESSSGSSASAGGTALSADQSGMFTDRDLDAGYDESSAALVQLTGDTAECGSDAVVISGGTITVTDEGTYLLSGTLSDGMVIVDAGEEDKVQLVLNGAGITSATSAAIYVREADKVFITTAPGSENTLSNGGEYVAIDDNNIDGAVFSKSDLTLNGEGALTIEAPAGHGVVSKDDLVLAGGEYAVTAESHGFSANDSIRIAGGTFTVQSGRDGFQAENDEDAELGFLYIAGGSFQVTAEGDGFSAGSYLQVEDGEFDITAGGGSGEPIQQSGGQGGWGQSAAAEEDTPSTKGLKAVTSLEINGGTFAINTLDDALHSNGDLTVNAGSFQIATGDDGVHADNTVTITGGAMDITQSYEGIEGLAIDIQGGEITLVASDDGLNAAGGSDSSGFGGRGDQFAAVEGAYIRISGGAVHVDASGDGIDSNGDLYITGGETYVSGPEQGADSTVDYNGEASITGGVFVGAGASGMAQNFGSASTQGVMMVSVGTQAAGTTVRLLDESGQELVSWQPDKSYSSVIVSCPEITQGSTYTLEAGDSSTQVTMDSLVYGSSGWGGMGGGPGGGGGRGGMGGPGGRG